MLVSGPVSDDNGQFLGVLAFGIDISPIYQMVQDATGLGQTGETLIAQNWGDREMRGWPRNRSKTARFKTSCTMSRTGLRPWISCARKANTPRFPGRT